MKSDSTKPTNPKDRAATDRIDLSLFPDTAVVYGALAMTEGDLKYGGYNYRPGGVQASVYVAACRRHLAKWWNGEDFDPATKVPHLASSIACLAVLIDALECDVLNDNRPPSVNMDRVMEKAREHVKHLQGLFPAGPGRYTEMQHGQAQRDPSAKLKGVFREMGRTPPEALVGDDLKCGGTD